MPQSIRNRRPAASSSVQLPVTSWFAPRNVIFIPKHLRLFRPTSPAVRRFPRKNVHRFVAPDIRFTPERRSRLVGHCPNSSALFPPQVAVAAVAFHRPPQPGSFALETAGQLVKSRAFLFCAYSIAYFKGTRRTNRRDFCGQSAERSKKFLYNLDKLPHSVINLDLYDVRSYFMSLK